MKTPRIAFIGESFGAEEEEASKRAGEPRPLVGASGKLFNALLKNIGIDRAIVRDDRGVRATQPDNILITNVFNQRPERNEVKRLFVSKKESHKDERCRVWPALEKGRYLDGQLHHHLDRLFDELAEFQPDVLVPMGNAALWALTRSTGILAHRGCWHTAGEWTGAVAGLPVVPTIHPAYILRKFVWFVLAVSDLRKAMSVGAGVLRPYRMKFIAEPTLADLKLLKKMKPPIIYDIETRPLYRAISIVGIGNRDMAIAIPFIDDRKEGRNYWPTVEAEFQAWQAVKDKLETDEEKVGQNRLYDDTWLREVFGIEVAGPVRDTRILHHAMWPELPHDLGAIATSFPDFILPPWKSDWKEAKSDH